MLSSADVQLEPESNYTCVLYQLCNHMFKTGGFISSFHTLMFRSLTLKDSSIEKKPYFTF